jgi:hypothetical protein
MGHDVRITSVVRAESSSSWPSVTAVAGEASSRDARLFKASGVLTLLAAVSFATGSLSPWVTYVLHSGATTGVNAFQFGAGESWTWFGPIILAGASLLAVSGVLTLFHPWRPNVCMPFIPTIVVGLEIVDVWQGTFGGVAGATTTLGPGSFECYAGLLLGVTASVLLLPAERLLTR